MGYIQLIQNGGFKMANASISLFSNKLHHHDITAIVKDYLCVSKLLEFIKNLRI